MAEGIAHQAYQLADLPTKSVTLYPSRAHVVREIRNVSLSQGQNEIEIYGLSPTIDDQSVQIDGHGAATVTDVTVELVDNKQSFEDLYGEQFDTDFSYDSNDSASEDSDDETTDGAIAAVESELSDLRSKLDQAAEVNKSTSKRLATLDQHAATIDAKNTKPEDLSRFLDVYDEQRSKVYKVWAQAKDDLANLQKSITKKKRELLILSRDQRKKTEEARKAKKKAEEVKRRRRNEKVKEIRKAKEEKLKFYPKMVYRLVVRLESATLDTPSSSRRNSMDNITLTGEPSTDDKHFNKGTAEGKKNTVNLSLSYVTNEASWSPRYDLNISSTAKSATIVYRAELSNLTSEEWRDAKVILSTSQTSFSGLDDKPPTLPGSWHVKLAKYADNSDGGRLSYAEIHNDPQYGGNNVHRPRGVVHKSNRALYFGAATSSKAQFLSSNHSASAFAGNSANVASWDSMPQQQMQQQAPQTHTSAALFSSAAPVRSLQAEAVPAPPRTRMRKMVTKMEAPPGGMLESGPLADEEDEEGIDFNEGDWEDNGLTTTYEIPGTRDLLPSSIPRRHKIARLVASNITLSYFAIPKVKASAYLRAKFKNPSSSITLLKGTTGVTLDDAFLGNTILSRSSPGQMINVPLGIDPGVHISYQKPTVHRGSEGFLFNKEAAHAFSRAIYITNTRNQLIELTVLDQVPISQDEKLRIDITSPKGLNREGDQVKTGASAKQDQNSSSAGVSRSGSVSSSSSSTVKWGRAIATMKKGGEVEFKVEVEKNHGAVLRVEYEARLPGSDQIVLAN